MSLVTVKPSVKRSLTYFDRKVIRTRWDRINRTPMQRAGNMVRMVARGSIRRRKKRKTPLGVRRKPGMQIKAGATYRGKPSPEGTAPRSWGEGTTPPFKMIFNVPHKMRMGGHFTHIIGMVGFGGANPVPGLHEHGGLARRTVYELGPQRRTKKGRFGKRMRVKKTRMVKYPKRAFMEPALMKTRSKLPAFWKGSVSRAA